MESSTVLAFRIFVMLSCLIIVPMAAIFGSAFPDVVKTVLVDRLVAWSTGKGPEAGKAPGPADGFSQVSASAEPARGNQQWEAPRWGGTTGDAAAWQSPAGPASSGVVPAGAASVQQAGGTQSANFVVPAEPNRSAAPAFGQERAASDDASRHGPNEMAQISYPVGASAGQPPATEGAHSLGAGPEQPDRFTAMERKLREYGAIYYLLETWGNEGELYRFHCRMALANNPNYTRHFEATDRDALKAMAQVLARVEAWRAGRLQ